MMTRLKRVFASREGGGDYLRHALGELVLLVIGILIALQIDNWNSEREQRQTLQRYLNAIASNIASDLDSLQAIRERRQSTLELLTLESFLIQGLPHFTIEEVLFENQALRQAQELLHFNANTSGHEMLQRSDAFELMQGRDIEVLLRDYYDTLARIAFREQNHNDFIKLIALQLAQRWPPDLDPFALSDPGALAPERFQSLQPSYAQLIHNQTFRALFNRAAAINPLLLDYHQLEHLGAASVHMIERGRMDLDPAIQALLDRSFRADAGVGYPQIIEDGRVSWLAYNLFFADSFQTDLRGHTAEQADGNWLRRVFRLGSIGGSGDRFRIAYPGGADWAGMWVAVRGVAESGVRPSLDFSAFDTLRLEIRGGWDGQTILLNLEDADDPQDGTSTRYPLTISDRWQTYEVDLAEFETADISKLWTPLGFVFLGDEAQAFSVRNVRYLQSN